MGCVRRPPVLAQVHNALVCNPGGVFFPGRSALPAHVQPVCGVPTTYSVRALPHFAYAALQFLPTVLLHVFVWCVASPPLDRYLPLRRVALFLAAHVFSAGAVVHHWSNSCVLVGVGTKAGVRYTNVSASPRATALRGSGPAHSCARCGARTGCPAPPPPLSYCFCCRQGESREDRHRHMSCPKK